MNGQRYWELRDDTCTVRPVRIHHVPIPTAQ